MGLQQQRAHEAVIRETAPPKLLELIRAGFEYTPELREVQSTLLADFDVARLRERVSAPECWRMLTEHIDKLERLQVLLHNELVKLRQSESAVEGAVREVLSVLRAVDAEEAALRAAAKRFATLPAEHLKRELGRVLEEAARAAREDAHLEERRRRSKEVEEEKRRRSKEEMAEAVGGQALVDELTQNLPTEHLIGLDALIFTKRIGSGAAGVTYLATYQGGTVAVKLASGRGGVDDWRREVRAIAQLRHTNVVRFLGVICAPPSVGLVIEYCEHGDVSTALARPTPPGFVLRVACGVASGMLHLHERGMLHRDLKGANVLLDGAWVVKISDFGLAAPAPDDTRRGGWLTAETGTYRYMAPEVVCHERYSKSADVFSYACLLFELLTHEQPFSDRPPLQAAVAVGLNHMRPPLPEGVPRPVRELVQGCWQHEPHGRPSFANLVAQLDVLPTRLRPEDRAWLDASRGHPVYGTAVQEGTAPTATTKNVAGGATRGVESNWLQAGIEWLKASLQPRSAPCVSVR